MQKKLKNEGLSEQNHGKLIVIYVNVTKNLNI